jgi:hypothetical protein
VLALLLAGCGAGFEAQTYQQRNVADVANGQAGEIAVRGLSLEPGRTGELAAGADAVAHLTLANSGLEDDRLVGADSPAAESVDVVELPGERRVASVDLPAGGTTGGSVGLVLRSLTDDLIAGEYAEVTLRFERNGEVTLQVPVRTTGEYDDEREKSENFHVPGEEGH